MIPRRLSAMLHYARIDRAALQGAVGLLFLSLVPLLPGQTAAQKIILPTLSLDHFLDEFPPEYSSILPFDPAQAASDPENAIVADRQRGFTPTYLSDDVFDFRKPLYSPNEQGDPSLSIDYNSLPPFRGDKAAAADQFVLARAFREDAAFDVPSDKPDRCLECFGDVLPRGYEWLYHENSDVAPIADLIDAVTRQWASPVLDKAKKFWHRPRPIASGDSRIQYLDLKEIKLIQPGKYDVYKTNSFPSGHSTIGMMDALILADIAPPEYRARLLARGIAFGDDRVILGVHYPSDVEAGRALALQLHAKLLNLPVYQNAVKSAHVALVAELAKFP